MLTTAERMEHMPFSGIRVVMEKATQMDARGEHVIHLELGRPDFDTPQVIKEAAYKREMYFTPQITAPWNCVPLLPKSSG